MIKTILNKVKDKFSPKLFEFLKFTIENRSK